MVVITVSEDYQMQKKEIIKKAEETLSSPLASESDRDRTYTDLLDLLTLSDVHKQSLLERGFNDAQIILYGYKSTPAFGYRKLAQALIDNGCTVAGVPGFYIDADGKWTINFSSKSSGFLIPVRNIDGLILGCQIRVDRPANGLKYKWFSSANYHMGVSSGSPIHFVGRPGDKVIYMTEGPLKGDLSHSLSGKTFGCVAGVNQSANLPTFLSEMKSHGTTFVYETYDMDKRLRLDCKADYNDDCIKCEYYNRGKGSCVLCEKKIVKRKNIQRGCQKLLDICKEMYLGRKSITWDIDKDGEWNGIIKGVDDYLISEMTY